MEKNILLIDDDLDFLKIYTDLMTDQGYLVHSFWDYKKAKQFLIDNPCLVDLIFCDIYMPERDGFQVFDDLQKVPLCEDIPFIFKTSSPDEYIFKRALFDKKVEIVNTLMSNSEILLRVSRELDRSCLIKIFINNSLKFVVNQVSSLLVYPSMGEELKFTDFELSFILLASKNKKPIDKKMFIEFHYGENYSLTDNNFNTALTNLRKKIAHTKAGIKTIRGQGAVFCTI